MKDANNPGSCISKVDLELIVKGLKFQIKKI